MFVLGMSESIGNLSFKAPGGDEGRTQERPYSDATLRVMDSEIRKFIKEVCLLILEFKGLT